MLYKRCRTDDRPTHHILHRSESSNRKGTCGSKAHQLQRTEAHLAVSRTILSVSARASLPTSCTISLSSSSFCNTSLHRGIMHVALIRYSKVDQSENRAHDLLAALQPSAASVCHVGAEVPSLIPRQTGHCSSGRHTLMEIIIKCFIADCNCARQCWSRAQSATPISRPCKPTAVLT